MSVIEQLPDEEFLGCQAATAVGAPGAVIPLNSEMWHDGVLSDKMSKLIVIARV